MQNTIKIVSRRDSENEIKEMESFVESLDESSRELIDSLFYDSKACYCTFEFKSQHPDFSSGGMQDILRVARNHLHQFEWDGWMEHQIEQD